ncbi:MAG: methyltransferase domain-containing protein [Pirellulales bacterium]|nr:methyltransferase domain-containing protein [Pirellulales bacterium]
MSYNVVLLEPEGYAHSQAFAEIGRLLECSFQSLGHRCRYQVNRLEPGDTNVLLGYHLIQRPEDLAGHRFVIYQLEQLSDREGWFEPRYLDLFHAAEEVWDYSPENLEFLAAKGVTNTRLLPIGFHERLRQIAHCPEPDIDVLFYGALNERRREVLDALARHGRVEALFGVYGQERDTYIGRSKILLNLHYYDAQVMEQARISYLLNNGCFVISEESPRNPFEGGIVTAPRGELVDVCRRYLAEPESRRRIAAAGAALFEKRPMTEYLREVLNVPVQGSGNEKASVGRVSSKASGSHPHPRPLSQRERGDAGTTVQVKHGNVKHKHNPLDLATAGQYFQTVRYDAIETIRTQGLPTGRVLEIGCAAGATARALREVVSVEHYVGIDVSAEAIELARASIDETHVADLDATTSGELGLKPDDFDLLLALDVLEHLRNPWDVLADLAQCVRPGGHAVLSLPNIQNVAILQDLVRGRWTYQSAGLLDATHLRFFTLREIETFVAGAGLNILDINAVLNPTMDLAQLPETGNTLDLDHLKLFDLTRRDVMTLLAYQYVVTARRP